MTVLERQWGITDSERAVLEDDWAFYRAQLPTGIDPIHMMLVRSGRRLVRPSPEHVCPGDIKVNDGERDWYLRTSNQFCLDAKCRVYLWDDPEGGGVRIQHGDNEEAFRVFPRRMFLSPTKTLSAERPDPHVWFTACHDHENGDRP